VEQGIGPVTLRLVEGDICGRDVDAVVNAANNQLWIGGGARRRGGGRGGEDRAADAVGREVG